MPKFVLVQCSLCGRWEARFCCPECGEPIPCPEAEEIWTEQHGVGGEDTDELDGVLLECMNDACGYEGVINAEGAVVVRSPQRRVELEVMVPDA